MKFISKAGKIYKKMAGNILLNECPMMSVSQYKRLIDGGDFYKLENATGGLEDYARVIASAFKDRLSSPGIYIPKHLDTIILQSEDPDADLFETRDHCDLARFTNGEKGDIALEIIRAIHDLWVEKNRERFFVESEAYQLYRFMPLELIGFDRVYYYYRMYLEPLFAVLHLRVDSCYIERAYALIQDTYFIQEAILNRDTLCNALRCLKYDSMSPIIREKMQSEDAISWVAAQIIDQNPVLCGE